MDGWLDGWMDVCMYVCMYVCLCQSLNNDSIVYDESLQLSYHMRSSRLSILDYSSIGKVIMSHVKRWKKDAAFFARCRKAKLNVMIILCWVLVNIYILVIIIIIIII